VSIADKTFETVIELDSNRLKLELTGADISKLDAAGIVINKK